MTTFGRHADDAGTTRRRLLDDPPTTFGRRADDPGGQSAVGLRNVAGGGGMTYNSYFKRQQGIVSYIFGKVKNKQGTTGMHGIRPGVRFTPESGHSGGSRCMSANDPKRTSCCIQFASLKRRVKFYIVLLVDGLTIDFRRPRMGSQWRNILF